MELMVYVHSRFGTRTIETTLIYMKHKGQRSQYWVTESYISEVV